MTQIKTKIPAELEPAAVGGMVTDSKYVKDRVKNKTQEEVNADTEERVSKLEESVGTGGSVDERIAVEKNRAEQAEGVLDGKVATEKQRAEGVEGGLNTRLQTVEQLATISVGGGDIGIGTAADFESDDPEDLAKVPTVGAMLGGANDGVYDISARHNGTKYADLAAALGTNGANVPVGVRKGGMSVKFVQSSDNKYIQYRYTGTSVTGNPNPFLQTENWQVIYEKPLTFVGNGLLFGYKTKDTIRNAAKVLHSSVTDNVLISHNYESYIIDVSDNIGYLFNMNRTYLGYYGFLTAMPNIGDTLSFVEGESLHTYAMNDLPYSIPQGSKYLYIRGNASNVYNIDPGITINGICLKDKNEELYKDHSNKNYIELECGTINYGNISVGGDLSCTLSNSGEQGYVYGRAIIKVTRGDILHITARGSVSSRLYPLVIADNNNKVVYISSADWERDKIVEIEQNGYVYIQHLKSQTFNSYITYKSENRSYSYNIENNYRIRNINPDELTFTGAKYVDNSTGLITSTSLSFVGVSNEIFVKKGEIIKVKNFYGYTNVSYAIAIRPENGTPDIYLDGYIASTGTQIDFDYVVPYNGYIRLTHSTSVSRLSYLSIKIISDVISDKLINDYKARLIKQEILHADYIGNFNQMESVSGLFVSDNYIDNDNETPKGYCSYSSSDSNEERSTHCDIVEFYLQEPSNRTTHRIVSVGDSIEIDGNSVTLGTQVQDPTICNIDNDYMYLTFRSIINDEGKTIGMKISKSDYSIISAKYITIDGVEPVYGSIINWSNTNIFKYSNRYYRYWRNDSVGSSIIVSEDLFDWDTYLDLTLYAPSSGSTAKYDEAPIFIEDNMIYIGLRNENINNLIRFDMTGASSSGNVATSENSISANIPILGVRTAMSLCDNIIYLIGTSSPNQRVINGATVKRPDTTIFKLDKNLNVLESFKFESPVGNNYDVLYTYKSQLIGVFNMNKQGQHNSNALERCGVYFTPLYSLTD